MPRRRAERGEGNLGCILWLLALGLVTLIAWKAVPVKIQSTRALRLHGRAGEVRGRTDAAGRARQDDHRTARKQLDIPLDKEDVQVDAGRRPHLHGGRLHGPRGRSPGTLTSGTSTRSSTGRSSSSDARRAGGPRERLRSRGACAGAQLAGLIFFLNPRLPFAVGPVLRGCLRLRRAARRWRAWRCTCRSPGAAAAGPAGPSPGASPWRSPLSAVLDWTHASYYAYFLPPGINDRLIKTAVWLTLGALIAFYTALLHSLSRRRYGRRSRWGLTLMAALSVYAMVERREAFGRGRCPPPGPAAVEAGQRPRLWVVGLESATLDAILPLAGQGRLPSWPRCSRTAPTGA